MKILVAIESSENAKTLASTTLRWAPRAGFNMRVFIPGENQLEAYKEAINDANYKWYIDLPETVLVYDETPKQFARREGFDLIVYLPDDLRKWKRFITHDLNVLDYAKHIGLTRAKFARDPAKKAERFPNGAIMERVGHE